MSEPPGGAHKPFLIDPEDEGKRPQGVDAWWIAEPFATVQYLLPRRCHGLPPFFYVFALVGLVWGPAFLYYRITGHPIPQGTTLSPAPPLPNVALDVVTIAMAIVGVVQGVGTLYRQWWGLSAFYAYAAAMGTFCWLGVAATGEGLGPAAGISAMMVAFAIYYHNRRAVFGRRIVRRGSGAG